MGATFSSRTFNFNTLLGRSSFPDYTTKRVKIPQFQRGFSWEKNHVATFWEDIWEFHQQTEKSDTYFLGPIVILPESDHITVLDGQQRLATATILLAGIRDLAREKGGQDGGDFARDIHRDNILIGDDKHLYALTPSDLDKCFFEDHIQGDPPPADQKPTIRSHHLIAQAKSFIRTSLFEHFGKDLATVLVDRLKKLRTTVTERLKLVVIEVGSEEEAYQIFETLNDRGLRLSVPDLLLNFLMRSTNYPSQREMIREYWNSIVETMGTRKVSTFLRHMWVSKHGDVKSQGLYREIRKYVKSEGVNSKTFAKACSDECSSYASIVDIDKELLKTSTPHIDALVKSLAAEKTLPALLSGIRCLNDNDFEKLCRNLVALVIRHSVFANLNPSVLEDTLFSVARMIRKKHSNGISSATILREAKKELKAINPTKEQLKKGLEDVFLTRTQAQYILKEIADKMQSNTKALTLAKNSIEHIFPEHAKETDWKDYEKLRPFIWHIGNLSILEPKINRGIGNKPFAEKVSKYNESTIEMTRVIPKKYSEWNVENVINRAVNLARVIDQVWFLQ